MKSKIYNSFEEIDLHLEILKTESQLERAHVKLNYQQARAQLTLIGLVSSLLGYLAKNTVLIQLIRKYTK